MDNLYLTVKLVHFWGWLVWVGTLFATAKTLLFRDRETDPVFRAKIGGHARRGMILGDIGFTVALACGVYLGVRAHWFQFKWLHIKLGLVLLLLALHVWMRIQAKRASRDGDTSRFVRPLFPLLTVLAVGTLYVALFKPAL